MAKKNMVKYTDVVKLGEAIKESLESGLLVASLDYTISDVRADIFDKSLVIGVVVGSDCGVYSPIVFEVLKETINGFINDMDFKGITQYGKGIKFVYSN